LPSFPVFCVFLCSLRQYPLRSFSAPSAMRARSAEASRPTRFPNRWTNPPNIR
jgi:hypothetical protein